VSNKGLIIKSAVSPGVPNTLVGDVNKLQQVLNNLIANAVKFTEKGGVFLKIWEEFLPEKKVLLNFSITDTGIGISSEEMKHLFKSFSQTDSSITRKYGGTGLGLAISKRLVEMMEGTIGVESIKGVGSTFRFSVKMEYTDEFDVKTNGEVCNVYTLDYINKLLNTNVSKDSEKDVVNNKKELFNLIKDLKENMDSKKYNISEDITIKIRDITSEEGMNSIKNVSLKLLLAIRRNDFEEAEKHYIKMDEELKNINLEDEDEDINC